MNKGNAYSDKDRQTISDFGLVFDSDAGERVLKWLETVLHVRLTVEPEEVINKQLESNGEPQRIPIDAFAMAKRRGMQSAYWKIIAMVEEAGVLKSRESVTDGR